MKRDIYLVRPNFCHQNPLFFLPFMETQSGQKAVWHIYLGAFLFSNVIKMLKFESKSTIYVQVKGVVCTIPPQVAILVKKWIKTFVYLCVYEALGYKR